MSVHDWIEKPEMNMKNRSLLIAMGLTLWTSLATSLVLPVQPARAAVLLSDGQRVGRVPEPNQLPPSTGVEIPPDSSAYIVNQAVHDDMPFVAQPLENWPEIVSQSAVVMDLNTGTMIYAKDPLARHYPASITKILTAMLALQKGNLNDELVTSQLATEQGGNRVYLVPGEVETLEQLLYGLLLNSGNDAAVVIAQHYGGSVQGFANMMNEEARALGAVHSHFVNPNGMPDPNHWTTAYDMALISRAAMQIPEFRKIVATKTYAWKGQAWSSTLVNLNHMLFTYPGTIGVKTGFTDAAHETLVVAATRGHQSFLAVLMDAPLDAQIRSDATELLNFSFAHYQTQWLLDAGTPVAKLSTPTGQLIPVINRSTVLATTLKAQPLQFSYRFVRPQKEISSLYLGMRYGQLDMDIGSNSVGSLPVYVDKAYHFVPESTYRVGYLPLFLLLLAVILALITRLALFQGASEKTMGLK